MNDSWIDFLKYSIHEDMEQPISVNDIDWKSLFDFMRKQASIGMMMHGMNKLKGVKIPREIIMQTFAYSEQVRNSNKMLYEKSVEVVEQYRNAGFECCILKGQGNAVMYPDPYMRMPGDVDVWVNGSREQIIQYVKQQYPQADIRYYHAEYHDGNVPVEAHFMPGIMNNPIYNRRLQQYYAAEQDAQCAHWVDLPDGQGKIPVPTSDFNMFFQLSHMMHHFFDEGIGLRQMLDYYYVLKDLKAGDRRMEIEAKFDGLGLRKFAGAVMYVLQYCFGLEDDYLIVSVDEKRGKTLMNVILKGGNFGQYSGLIDHDTATKYMLKNWRSIQLIKEYPAEALAEPLFRTYHFFWRTRRV